MWTVKRFCRQATTQTMTTTAERLFGSKNAPSLVLAPMVRAGTLPLRLASLHFGAQTTWSEELIAKRLVKCKRVENQTLGTIDFVAPSNHLDKDTLVYQTCPLEAGRNILQIGAANPEEAVEAAKIFMNDIAGIDLNCGCPEKFSLSGGMGAALLSQPHLTASIVKALRSTVPTHVTVSCKIRLHETPKETIDFIGHLVKAGVDAITIHARRIPERPRDKARWEELEHIVATVEVPVILNGDVFTKEDHRRILQSCPSASGAMVARGAISDFSLAFRGQALSIDRIINAYLNIAQSCVTPVFPNCKWFASQVMRYRSDDADWPIPRKVMTESLARAKNFDELREAFGTISQVSGDAPSNIWKGLDRTTMEGWAQAVARACETEIPKSDITLQTNVHPLHRSSIKRIKQHVSEMST